MRLIWNSYYRLYKIIPNRYSLRIKRWLFYDKKKNKQRKMRITCFKCIYCKEKWEKINSSFSFGWICLLFVRRTYLNSNNILLFLKRFVNEHDVKWNFVSYIILLGTNSSLKIFCFFFFLLSPFHCQQCTHVQFVSWCDWILFFISNDFFISVPKRCRVTILDLKRQWNLIMHCLFIFAIDCFFYYSKKKTEVK